MALFEKDHPEIARYWLNPATLEGLDTSNQDGNAPIYETWDAAAKRLMSKLWKVSSAWIFHEAVDAHKLQIPDYFDVVKEPMDFGTIKNKLHNNQYKDGI